LYIDLISVADLRTYVVTKLIIPKCRNWILGISSQETVSFFINEFKQLFAGDFLNFLSIPPDKHWLILVEPILYMANAVKAGVSNTNPSDLDQKAM
jgi:hypothetical protein